MLTFLGGIGYDIGLNLKFKLLNENDNKTPSLFYTGEYNLHKKPYESARGYFHILDIFIEPNIGHEYKSNCEDYMLNLLESINKNIGVLSI